MLTADFFWVCVREAARGTISRANTWFWAVGLPIVGAAFWYFDDLVLSDIPETVEDFPSVVPDFTIFVGETIVVTWIVFFSFRLLGAPGRVWFRAVQENDRLVAVLANQERRLQLKSLLGEAIVCGEKLLQESNDGAMNPESFEHDALMWAEKTRALVSSAFGRGEAVLFSNSSGYPVLVSPNRLAQIRVYLDCRLKRLAELIPRADTLPIDEGFTALSSKAGSCAKDQSGNAPNTSDGEVAH